MTPFCWAGRAVWRRAIVWRGSWRDAPTNWIANALFARNGNEHLVSEIDE